MYCIFASAFDVCTLNTPSNDGYSRTSKGALDVDASKRKAVFCSADSRRSFRALFEVVARIWYVPLSAFCEHSSTVEVIGLHWTCCEWRESRVGRKNAPVRCNHV